MNSLFSPRNFSILFLCLIPAAFLHYRFPSPGGSGLVLPTNIAVWLGVGFTIFFSAIHVALSRKVYVHKYHALLFVSFLICLIPLLYTETRFVLVNSNRFLGIFIAILFSFFIYQLRLTRKELGRVAIAILIGAFIQSVFGIIQYYVFEADNLFSFDVNENRPYGTVNQYNVYATILVSAIPIGAAYFRYYCKTLTSQTLLLFCLFVISIPVVPAQSRLGVLSFLIVGLASTFFLISSKAGKNKVVSYTFVLILGFLFHKILTPYDTKAMPIAKEAEQSSTQIIRQTKIGTRVTIYPVALSLFLEEPIKGHGYGTFQGKYLEKQGEYIKDKLKVSDYVPGEFYLGHPHNEIIYWAVEGGLLGVAVVLTPLFLLLYTFFRLGTPSKFLMVMALSPILLHINVEHPFYISAYLFIFFVMLTTFFMSAKHKNITIRFSRYPLIIISFVALFFAVSYLDAARVTTANLARFNHYGQEDLKYILNTPKLQAFRERIDYHIMNHEMRKQRDEGQFDDEFMRKYLLWAYSFIQNEPRPELYRNVAQIFLMAGYIDKAVATSNRAALLYPYDEKTIIQNQDMIKNHPQFKDSYLKF